MNDTVVAIVSAFFIIGITVGSSAALGEGKLPRVLGRGRGAR